MGILTKGNEHRSARALEADGSQATAGEMSGSEGVNVTKGKDRGPPMRYLSFFAISVRFVSP